MPDSCIHITLVRHGESLANLTQRWQGQGDSALSELGQKQALAVAKRLSARRFDRVIASDLQRADATARALARPYTSDAGFREFDIGAWEGLTREQVAERFGDELARLENGEDVALGGGENYGSFCARIDASLARVREQLAPGQHGLVVCHGGVIGALVSGALGLRGVRELPIARVLNTSITELSYDVDGLVTLKVFNDSLHLGPLALFPHPTEMSAALALVCAAAPDEAFGPFAAHYDCQRGLGDLLGRPDGSFSAREPEGALRPARVTDLLASMRARHPERRVSLSTSASRIHGWAGEAVWPAGAPSGRLRAPAAGAVCHISVATAHPVLIDYGVVV